MTVLGIETATSVCAAAVVTDGAVVREVSVDQKYVHAERLMGQISDVLAQAGITVRSLDAVAVSIGPGSFTGLRIGLSVAKGLVYAAGIPLVAVPTLEALARHTLLSEHPAEGEWVLAALDARRDEVYCQLFEVRRGTCIAAWDARDLSVARLRGELEGRVVLVTGDAVEKVLGAARGEWPGAVRGASGAAQRCSAGSVALMGSSLLRKGVADDPRTLEPHYIKEFFLKTR